MMKNSKLKDMSSPELEKELSELKSELFKLRFSLATNGLDNPLKVREVKKDIARIKTILRQRELATLKVLGFYNREIDQYVNREMIFLTLLGMGLGLIVGTLLSTFVLTVAEREQMIFPKVIEPISYVYTMIIILTFAVITNFASHFAMKKINMIDSLKSIE